VPPAARLSCRDDQRNSDKWFLKTQASIRDRLCNERSPLALPLRSTYTHESESGIPALSGAAPLSGGRESEAPSERFSFNLGGASPCDRCEAAIEATEQLSMSRADRGLIVVHRVDKWSTRRFRVSIDGRQAGYVKPRSSTEFPVEPGTHVVDLAIDWSHSVPLHLEAAPGSRTDLNIAWRHWWFLRSAAPGAIFIILANLLASLLSRANLWSALGLLGVFGVILLSSCLTFALIRIASLLIKDCFAVWILEPMSGSVSGRPSPVAG
jgi:hypothetical protein